MVRAFRTLGLETMVLGSKALEPRAAQATSAAPFFSISPYARTSDDPICGWLKTFTDVAGVFASDFQRIDGLTPQDIVYYDTATPAPLLGLFTAIQAKYTPATCPRIIASLIEHPGLIADWLPDGTRRLLLNNNPQTLLYRYVGKCVPAAFAAKLTFISLDDGLADVYSELLTKRVLSLPHPYEAATSCRRRQSRSPLILGFLGAQRENKGFHLVPGIVRKLLAEIQPIRIIVHNSWQHMQSEMSQLQEIAANDDRLEVIGATKDPASWIALLNRCDLLIAPYDRGQYAITPSGIVCEGLANAIPVAVPTRTALERALNEYGRPGVSFESIDPEGVTAAVKQAIASYDVLGERAAKASQLWHEKNGAPRLAGAIIKVATG